MKDVTLLFLLHDPVEHLKTKENDLEKSTQRCTNMLVLTVITDSTSTDCLLYISDYPCNFTETCLLLYEYTTKGTKFSLLTTIKGKKLNFHQLGYSYEIHTKNETVQTYPQTEDVPFCYWTSLYVMYLPAVSLGLMIFTTWRSSKVADFQNSVWYRATLLLHSHNSQIIYC